jgi:hypothetical protein
MPVRARAHPRAVRVPPARGLCSFPRLALGSPWRCRSVRPFSAAPLAGAACRRSRAPIHAHCAEPDARAAPRHRDARRAPPHLRALRAARARSAAKRVAREECGDADAGGAEADERPVHGPVAPAKGERVEARSEARPERAHPADRRLAQPVRPAQRRAVRRGGGDEDEDTACRRDQPGIGGYL